MGGNGVLGILRLSYNQSDPAAFEGLLKMESSDMRDDEYEGGPGTRLVSKVNYPTYPPTKAPPPPLPLQVDKPTTLQPRGGSYLPRRFQPWLGGWIRGMNTFGGILCKYRPRAICGIAAWVGWYICK